MQTFFLFVCLTRPLMSDFFATVTTLAHTGQCPILITSSEDVNVLEFAGASWAVFMCFVSPRAGSGAVSVVNTQGDVTGVFSRSDMTFLARGEDPIASLEVAAYALRYCS